MARQVRESFLRITDHLVTRDLRSVAAGLEAEGEMLPPAPRLSRKRRCLGLRRLGSRPETVARAAPDSPPRRPVHRAGDTSERFGTCVSPSVSVAPTTRLPDEWVADFGAVTSEELAASGSCALQDIVGAARAKQALYDVVLLPKILPPSAMAAKARRPMQTLLLFGPPGTGKTSLTRAVVASVGRTHTNLLPPYTLKI